eukprot:m.56410 g.56410  ORF g.56410 m.56410 type:complete len:383 (+) comp34599_c1_seq2:502-1650(+)
MAEDRNAEDKPRTDRQKAALRLLVLQERAKAKQELERRAQEKEKHAAKREEAVEESGRVEEEKEEKEIEVPVEECSKLEAARAGIEQIKEEMGALEKRLEGLQEQKHQLFLQLKKVLHEDEKKRQEEESIKSLNRHLSIDGNDQRQQLPSLEYHMRPKSQPLLPSSHLEHPRSPSPEDIDLYSDQRKARKSLPLEQDCVTMDISPQASPNQSGPLLSAFHPVLTPIPSHPLRLMPLPPPLPPRPPPPHFHQRYDQMYSVHTFQNDGGFLPPYHQPDMPRLEHIPPSPLGPFMAPHLQHNVAAVSHYSLVHPPVSEQMASGPTMGHPSLEMPPRPPPPGMAFRMRAPLHQGQWAENQSMPIPMQPGGYMGQQQFAWRNQQDFY